MGIRGRFTWGFDRHQMNTTPCGCGECRQPIGVRVPLFGTLANVCELLPRDA